MASCRTLSARRRRHTWPSATFAAGGLTRSSGPGSRPIGPSLATLGAGCGGGRSARSRPPRWWPPCCWAVAPSRRARWPSRSRGTRSPRSRRSTRSSLASNRRTCMRFRDFVSILTGATLAALPVAARPQDSAQAAHQAPEMRPAIQQIARDRPPQAEAAAREMVRRLQIERAALDSLRQRSLAEYWAEVAQLTVQREMLMHQEDSLRQNLMAQMFGAEARARALQRDYRETADSTRERAIRERLRVILERHFTAEDSLRTLEIADVERRLAQVRAETERRRRERAALVRQMVDQGLRDAGKPE